MKHTKYIIIPALIIMQLTSACKPKIDETFVTQMRDEVTSLYTVGETANKNSMILTNMMGKMRVASEALKANPAYLETKEKIEIIVKKQQASMVEFEDMRGRLTKLVTDYTSRRASEEVARAEHQTLSASLTGIKTMFTDLTKTCEELSAQYNALSTGDKPQVPNVNVPQGAPSARR